MDTLICKRVRVRGRVQGVFFRGATAQQARALGVAGWVRNCDDGSVEAVFEGAPARVAAAVSFCHQGPARARVDHVESSDEVPSGLRDFVVRR
jgi:acylphosphatase